MLAKMLVSAVEILEILLAATSTYRLPVPVIQIFLLAEVLVILLFTCR